MTPLPWIEISRESSPDGQVDAVLVTRRDSGPPQYLVSDPTDLYLVPRGVEVPREPPYPPYNVAPRPIEKIRAQTPFHGFEVIDPVIVWRGNTLLRVGAKKGEIHKRASEHTVNVGGQPVTVQIEYYIEWDSMSEEKGPALPVE